MGTPAQQQHAWKLIYVDRITDLLIDMLARVFPYRFLLARATRLPVIGRIADLALFSGDDIIYLPQDRVLEVGKVIEPGEQTFLPSQAAEYFIERSSHRFIMDFCICRRASGCRDYPVEPGCLFLGEAASKIDPSFGRMATKEEAIEHLRRCREAGLVHLIGRNKLDSLWLGTGQPDRLLTICNCCPCCCLWKILPAMVPAIGGKVTKMPGLDVVVTDGCTGCGACMKTCFMNAITIKDGKAMISGQCRGCGRCAVRCPRGAVEVRMGDLEKTVERISAAVDVT